MWHQFSRLHQILLIFLGLWYPAAWARAAVLSSTYSQKLDHADPADGRRFDQRYFIDTSCSGDPNAPVFLFIGGESYVEAKNLDGYLLKAAAGRFGGCRVVVEHRYYGESRPFTDPTIDDLKYLTAEQAIEDLAEIQKFLTTKYRLKGKWVAMGGSYPGGLAALFRSRYPNLVAGALASSAGILYNPVTPFDPARNFPQIHDELDKFTSGIVGPQCAANLENLNRWVHAQLNDSQKYAKLLSSFTGDKIDDPFDFYQAYRMILGAGIQYGAAPAYCAAAASAQPWDDFVVQANLFLQRWGISLFQLSFQFMRSPIALTGQKWIQQRLWNYQKCMQFGWFGFEDDQTGKYWCHRTFGITDFSGIQRAYNELYLPLLDPAKTSNIFFTNGTTDAVSAISISEYMKNTTNPNNFYFTIQDGTHCADLLKSRNPEVIKAQEKFLELVSEWIN